MSTDAAVRQDAADETRGVRLASPRGLLAVHLFVAVQTGILLTGWDAVVYAFFPFMLPDLLVGVALRAPLFSLLCLVASSLTATGAHLALRARVRATGLWLKVLGGITLAVWTPVLCGESIRLVLAAPALASVPEHCHGGQSLLESIRDISNGRERRKPHAWLVKSGRMFMWSYRTLDFEPADDWADAEMIVSRCANAR
jgi:hypothetical protein